MSEMRLGYRFCRFLCQGYCAVYLKARCFGVHNLPATGGVLLVSNHQSFLDPVLTTMALYREGNYMARDSLFNSPWLRRLIEYLNAFPVRRNTADIAAIKESMRRLKQGRVVLMFPEGTRTPDGRIQPLLPGMFAIAKKTGVPIVPVLVDGMFQAWPRHQLLPSPGNVIVEYGKPVWPAQFEGRSPEQLMELVRQRLIAMQHRWHRLLPERRLEWYRSDECPAETASSRE